MKSAVFALVTLVWFFGAATARAQSTRAEQLAALRAARARDIAAGRIEPNRWNGLERVVAFIEDGPVLGWFNQEYAGFHPVVGDLVTGSGLAFGVAYRWPLGRGAGARARAGAGAGADDGFVAASASVSTELFRRLRAEILFPALENLSIGLRARYRNYPELVYFGRGIETRPSDETSYGLEDRALELEAAYRFRPWLRAGLLVAGFDTSIGPGSERKEGSTTVAVFDELRAPGVTSQPAFMASGAFVELDVRDVPRNARAGAFYRFEYRDFDDLGANLYAFDRFDLEATHHLPFFDKRRIVVLHGRFIATSREPGSNVPFYLMPYLGGSASARGFREYRFHDRNLLALNAEYRWEALAALDMALFVDAGTVSPDIAGIDLFDLKTSYGLGFRFSTRNQLAFRLDIGTGGGEGTYAFLKFSHAF
jgi:hypothetical protein